MPAIFPPIQNAKLVNADGTPTPLLVLYLNQIQNRLGGALGGQYSKLTSTQGSILWDVTASPVAVVTLASGVNLLTVINQVAGFLYPYRLTAIQPPNGAAGTFSYGGNWLFPGGSQPTLSTGNSAIDQFFYTSDGTNMSLCVEGLNYSS